MLFQHKIVNYNNLISPHCLVASGFAVGCAVLFFFLYLCLFFFFKYCRPFEVSSLKYPRTSRCTRVFPLSSYILCSWEVSVDSPGTYWIFLPFLPAHGKANPFEHRYRRMLHHDKAIITTDTSTATFTVHLLPSDVLRACKTANTAFVWLVGISTLQIMPSQQETHSCWEKGDHWTRDNLAWMLSALSLESEIFHVKNSSYPKILEKNVI